MSKLIASAFALVVLILLVLMTWCLKLQQQADRLVASQARAEERTDKLAQRAIRFEEDTIDLFGKLADSNQRTIALVSGVQTNMNRLVSYVTSQQEAEASRRYAARPAR